MVIRRFVQSDLEELKRIHQQYEDDYPFDVFNDPHFLSLFSVLDSDGSLVSGGGIRLIPEIIIATDQQKTILKRGRAFLEILHVAENLMKLNNFHGFSAQIQDENWYNQLRKYGFKPSKGKSLYYAVAERI